MPVIRLFQLLLIIVFVVFTFINVACSEETEASPKNDDNTSEAESKSANNEDNTNNADEVSPESEIEKLQKKYTKEELAQIREEIEEHKDIENIRDADKRFEYVKRITDAQKRFITFGLEMILDGMYQRQQTQKSEQPVFNIIYGYFLFVTSRGDENRRNRGIRHIRKAIELDDNFEFAHYILGSTLLNAYMTTRERALLNTGIAQYQKALRLRDNFYDVHRALGQAYMELGNNKMALEKFERAIQLNKDDSDNWIALIILYFNTGEFTKAEQTIDDADIKPRIKYQAYGQMCLEFERKEQFTRAWNLGLKAYEQLKKVKENEVPRENWIAFYTLMANLAQKKAEKDVKTAEEFLDKIFEVEKTNFQATRLLMAIAYDVKSVRLLEKAIQKWLDYIELEPLSSTEENMVYDFITLLARVLVEISPEKIKGNTELVLVLLKWALSVRGKDEDEALKKAGRDYLVWMFPLEEDPKNKGIKYISDKNIKVIENPDDLKLIINGLIRASKSDELRILRPATSYLGAIVRASGMQSQIDEFKEFIAETFALPATSSNNRIKSALCQSIKDFNDPSLSSEILLAMKLVLDTESTSECHRYFPDAHSALNSLLKNPIVDDSVDRRLQRRQLRMDFYQELYDQWVAIMNKSNEENSNDAESNDSKAETENEN